MGSELQGPRRGAAAFTEATNARGHWNINLGVDHQHW
jgi:hypothetical protein